MAANYGALQLSVEEEKPKRSPMRSGAIAAVVVAVCVMFFAGRAQQSMSTPFTHSEVMNVAKTCGPKQFIGACTKCTNCASYEYANGGCTYFKDRFCSYCEPIAHCQRENTVCTNRHDQTCKKCDCTVPITSHNAATQEWINMYGGAGKQKYSCYFDKDCKPCKVCATHEFQKTACNSAGNKGDTVCQSCKICAKNEFVQKKCTYLTDTVCKTCHKCSSVNAAGKREFTAKKCTSNMNHVFNKDGADTKCGKCKSCSSSQFVAAVCTIGKYDGFKGSYNGGGADTTCGNCGACKDGERITKVCSRFKSKNPYKKGNQVQCTACSKNPGCLLKAGQAGFNKMDCLLGRSRVKSGATETEGQSYRTKTCRPNDTRAANDATYASCTVCDAHKFTATPCKIGSPADGSMAKNQLGANTVCKMCPKPAADKGLSACDDTKLRCPRKGGKAPKASTCTGCTGVQKETWGNCCKDGSLGKTCAWKKQNTNCFGGKNGNKFYKERTKKRGGFKGFKERGVAMAAQTGPNGFVRWCKSLCESFPTCTAFEVDSCLFKAKGACALTDNTLCALSNQKTTDAGVEVGKKAGKTCFKNPKTYK